MYGKNIILTLSTVACMGLLTACGGGGSGGGGLVSAAIPIENIGEGKTCLLGSWKPDLDDLEILQKEVLGAETVSIRGTVVMRFIDSERVQTDVPSLTTDAKLPDQPLISVVLTGLTDAIYFANDDEGTLEMTTVDFSYVASTVVLGEPLDIPISAADGLFGSFLGVYNCTGNTLIIQTGVPQKSIARLWHRI